MKKKILLSFMLACIGIFAVGVLNVSAGTYGDLTYKVSNGEVTITDCNTSATGDMIIPEKIDNYPVTSIGYEAFEDCSSLTSINIPDSVTSIGYEAFSGCSSLTSINIPDSVTSIGSWPFYGCNSLTGVYITDIAAWCNISFSGDCSNPLSYAHNLYLNGELVTNLIIPDGVTSIGSCAFYGYSSIKSITLPKGLTSIGYEAFSGCSSLTSINIPDSVTSIGSWAFKSCSNLTSVTLPAGVTSIGDDAFYSCSNIESLYITDLAAYLNCRYENDCSNPMYYAKKMYINGKRAIKVIIPDGVTQIPEYAFYNCSSLTEITIPDSVTSIGYYSFCNCSSLTSISLPNGITSVGAFKY